MIYKEELSFIEDNDISYFIALVAQVVEQSPEKACVGGSSPPQGTKSKLECYILKLAINLKIY